MKHSTLYTSYILAALLCCAIVLPTTVEAVTQPSFKIFGQVSHPGTVTLADLKSLPVANQTVTYFAAGAVTSHVFTGTPLWSLLEAVGLKVPSEKNGILRLIVIVTGTDGYESAFGVGEVSPDFGGDQIIVAYAQDSQVFPPATFTKIIAPGDKLGGRFVDEIAKIEVRNVDLPVSSGN
ncbi:MAG TPA: molybdopterin-dependent oxidoreductase [Methylocella sp.]|nr:molybdopterin-dependent oxidoreductase [Methylocella sp.]